MLNVQAAINVIEGFSLADAGLVALEGMLIVFSVLIILMIVLYIMKLFAKEEKVQTVASSANTVQSVAPAANTDETIAAICAAVGAMSGDDPTKRMRVVSIADQNGNYVWKK